MNLLSHQHPSDALEFSISKMGLSYRVSRNFRLVEFASNDGSDFVLLHPSIIIGLQHLRDHIQLPITINSGYRSPPHNRNIGGATSSFHVRGMAADIVIAGRTPIEVASLAHDMGFGGIKAYPSFTHVDVGPRRTW